LYYYYYYLLLLKIEFDKGSTVTLLLQDLTMLPCRYTTENDYKTGKFSVPARIRQSVKQPRLTAAENSKSEL